MSGDGMISVAEALARVLASARKPVGRESVTIEAALGRTLASDLCALRTQPPFANSAMDGYALRAADTARLPARLRIIGESAAGRAFAGTVGANEAVRIFTGAPMPEGADTVLIQENAERDGDFLIARTSEAPRRNVRDAGIDFIGGELLLPAGRCLRPRELARPGSALGPSQIVASNNYAVAGIVTSCGGEPVDLGIAGDDVAALARSFRRAREIKAHVLGTLGGASVGDYDLVQRALVDAGLELGFWRIAMRPGKPLMQGR